MSRDRDLQFPNRDGLRLLFPFDYRQGKYAFQSRDWGTVSITFTSGYLEMLGLLRLCLFGDVWVYIDICYVCACILYIGELF